MEQNTINSNSSNDSNNIPYSKINTKEDTYLDLRDNKNQISYTDVNPYINNSNEIDNDYKTMNNDDNKHQRQGILNRKLSEYFYMKIGNTHTFFGDKDGSPLFVIGPHWPM